MWRAPLQVKDRKEGQVELFWVPGSLQAPVHVQEILNRHHNLSRALPAQMLSENKNPDLSTAIDMDSGLGDQGPWSPKLSLAGACETRSPGHHTDTHL